MPKTNSHDLAGLDIRALHLLRALIETASVTKAGEAVGLSQPSASRALAALRRAFGDPLLVRAGGGYAPTSRAASLRANVETVLAALAALAEPADFEPARATRVFRVAATDYGAATAILALGPLLAREAPRARLDVLPWTASTLADVEAGELDAALYADAPLPPDFHARELFRDDYVCVLRADHPIARLNGAKRARALRAARRVVVLYPDGRRLAEDDVLAELGADPAAVAIRTPYFLVAASLVASGDLVLALPRRVAHRVAAAGGLAVVPTPGAAEGFGLRLIWHARAHRDPAHRWLRDLAARAVR
jgi:DNA-binding transcriptional LysR family regulator